MTQPQTDAQAALAAAALIVSSESGNGATFGECEVFTLQMADAFLGWLKRQGGAVVTHDADERLTPNVDFRSPSQARTERVDPSAVLAAAAERTMLVRTTQRYAGPHALDPVHTTPSGKYACLCGEAWPCSQYERGA